MAHATQGAGILRYEWMRAVWLLVCAVAAASESPSRRAVARPTIARPTPRTHTPHQPRLQASAAQRPPEYTAPSFYWGLLPNFLYFVSLSFSAPIPYHALTFASYVMPIDGGADAINMGFLIAQITDGTLTPSPQSIALGGRVEFVDKILTFLGVGLLCSLSDVKGRTPIMAWSAFGFMLTHLLQAFAKGPAMLYLADLIDGCSSCMTYICQAYVADCSPPEKRASHLGMFQGLSIGLGLTLGFPIGGLLGAKARATGTIERQRLPEASRAFAALRASSG